MFLLLFNLYLKRKFRQISIHKLINRLTPNYTSDCKHYISMRYLDIFVVERLVIFYIIKGDEKTFLPLFNITSLCRRKGLCNQVINIDKKSEVASRNTPSKLDMTF